MAEANARIFQEMRASDAMRERIAQRMERDLGEARTSPLAQDAIQWLRGTPAREETPTQEPNTWERITTRAKDALGAVYDTLGAAYDEGFKNPVAGEIVSGLHDGYRRTIEQPYFGEVFDGRWQAERPDGQTQDGTTHGYGQQFYGTERAQDNDQELGR